MSDPAIHLQRAVLWDLDGTLADSSEQHWRAWRDAMAAAGRTLTVEQFAATFGQRNDRFLRGWLGDDLPEAEVARFGHDKEARYRRLIEAQGLEPLPGAVSWVRRLNAGGWRQAVASSAPRENIDVMLRAIGLDAVFDACVGAEDVTVGKPDPEIFLVAASRLGVVPSRAIVVEDAVVGIEAAKRAGMRSIAVGQRAGRDADLVVETLAELPDDTFEKLLIPGATPSRV
jgi:HAD superfamily hydrolase (TIGR01509 family)